MNAEPTDFQPSYDRRRTERRRTLTDALYARLTDGHESFWLCVYQPYMDREITRSTVREIVRKGLEESRGSYKGAARLFNLETQEYKRFLNFLRRHKCLLPFMEFRQQERPTDPLASQLRES